jgi:anaerobic magnesium-protoporphyrin IX monomethyl ester cyclase
MVVCGSSAMRILFVHTALPGVRFNTSIAALSAWLKRHGHETSLLIVPESATGPALAAALAETRAEVVALSFMTCCAALAKRVVAAARASLPSARVIAGGAHPTTYPAETLGDYDVDAIGVGEGEEPLRAWIDDPSRAHPGILRRGHADPLVRWWAPDVDDLPDWDRRLFGPVRNEGNRYEIAVGVAFARGFCPYTCTFCGVDAYRRANQQPSKGSMRMRTVERVLAEMKRVVASQPVPHGFGVWDEILPPKREWLAELAPRYRDEIGLPLAAQARIEQITPATVELMRTAGLDYLVLGIETGDEGYRAKFLDKRFTNDETRRAFALLKAAGIQTFASFMLGLPYETPQMLAATVRLARELEPTVLSWKYYTPERGTRLFELVRDRGLVIDKYVDHPFGAGEPMIKLERATQADVDKARRALEMLRAERGETERGTYEEAPPTDDTLLEHRT